jgi:molecular chaperone GrpE (heat shock protein)
MHESPQKPHHQINKMKTPSQDAAQVDPNKLTHVHQQVLQLADSVSRMQTALASLAVRLQEDSIQINALVRHLTDTQSTQLLQERLADFSEQLSADHEQLNYLSGQLNQLATRDQLVRLATQVATQEKIAELANTVEKLSRSQHRANLLAETKAQQLDSALAALQEIVAKREARDATAQAHTEAEMESVRRAARGEMAIDLFPALDMFETILAQGQTLLDKRRAEHGALTAVTGPDTHNASGLTGPSLLSKLRARMGGDVDAETAGLLRRLPESMQDSVNDFHEWLQTISLLRDHLLGVLRNEGIEPIGALHQLLDPHLHVAVGSEPRTDLAPQTVIREVRKGYRQGVRTLRHSEVVVSHRPAAARATAGAPAISPMAQG